MRRVTRREVLRLARATGAGLLGPKAGGDYFDTFEYKYVMEKRQPIARFYASLKS